MRTRYALYTEYLDGAREYYDLRKDPFELHNVYRDVPRPVRRRLHRQLSRLRHCHGLLSCRRAARVR